jgi:hypothetical protein
MSSSRPFWLDLLGAAEGEKPRSESALAGELQRVQFEWRILSKHGRPFLLLPAEKRPALAALSLYPAQTPRARLARTLVRWLVQSGLPLGIPSVTFEADQKQPFVEFLCSLCGKAPHLGILAGNPASAGQRFLLLVFGPDNKPACVVKAGVSQEAQALVEKEAKFLGSVPGSPPSIPKLRRRFRAPRLQALLVDFFEGDSPRPEQADQLPALLGSWVDPGRKAPLASTSDWMRLEQAAAGHALFQSQVGPLRTNMVSATLAHNDFAPWNIKVSPRGKWMVLDWERGELAGIPGWDWFHYVIQTGILVEHRSTAELVQKMDCLLQSPRFKEYAQRSGIMGFERALVLAYLLNCVEVIRPSEGLTEVRELLGAFR